MTPEDYRKYMEILRKSAEIQVRDLRVFGAHIAEQEEFVDVSERDLRHRIEDSRVLFEENPRSVDDVDEATRAYDDSIKRYSEGGMRFG